MDAITAWLAANGGGVGFAGLITLAVWLIFTGRLVPRSSVDSLRADWTATMEGKDVQIQDWKQTAYRALDTVAALGKQNDELLEGSRTIIRALTTQQKEAP